MAKNGTVVNKNTNVNANVNEMKEEKRMTKQIKSVFKGFAEIQAKLEKEHVGVSFGMDAKSPGGYAQFDRLGMHIEKVKNIELVTSKREANEDKGTDTVFTMKLHVEFENNELFPHIFINLNYFLYNGDEKVDNVHVYHAVTDGAGKTGYYYTIKEESLTKKAEEITFDDLDAHALAPNQRIWAPGRKELIEIRDILKLEELEFDEGKVIIPSTGFEAPIYVYEDVVERTTRKMKDEEEIEVTTTEYFHNASFIPPERQLTAGKIEKYRKTFTTSEDINRIKTIQNLPGVVAYKNA